MSHYGVNILAASLASYYMLQVAYTVLYIDVNLPPMGAKLEIIFLLIKGSVGIILLSSGFYIMRRSIVKK